MLVLYAHTDIVSRSSKTGIMMDLPDEFAQKNEKSYISNGWISMRWLSFCSKLRDSTWIIIFFKWCISFHRWLSPNGYLERTFRLPWHVRFWFARSADVWPLHKFLKSNHKKSLSLPSSMGVLPLPQKRWGWSSTSTSLSYAPKQPSQFH